MSKKVRVGYIGWLFYDETEYSIPHSICDINEEKLAAFKAEHPTLKVFTDYREMAEDPELDVVIISTPNWLHCEMTECFLQNGKHVFCEKPMGVNRDEMNRMLKAQRASGCQLSLDFEKRVSPGYLRAKEILDSGEIGAVKGVEFIHHRGAWLEEGAMKWRTKPELSGGLFFMEPCHDIDLFRFLIGEISHVQSFKFPNVLGQYEEGVIPDNVTTHLFFENGAKGTILSSHALSVFTAKFDEYADMGHDMQFIFYCEKGAMRLDCITDKILVVDFKQYPEGSHGVRVELNRIEHIGDNAAWHDITQNRLTFIKACADGVPHIQDAYDAWRTHCVCLAAEQSALEECTRIKVDYSE
jgi:predicted dehydrogenase